jgi:hypothetical protein
MECPICYTTPSRDTYMTCKQCCKKICCDCFYLLRKLECPLCKQAYHRTGERPQEQKEERKRDDEVRNDDVIVIEDSDEEDSDADDDDDDDSDNVPSSPPRLIRQNADVTNSPPVERPRPRRMTIQEELERRRVHFQNEEKGEARNEEAKGGERDDADDADDGGRREAFHIALRRIRNQVAHVSGGALQTRLEALVASMQGRRRDLRLDP